MNWLAWSLAGALIVALWLVVMFMAAFGSHDPPFAAICALFGAVALAWLGLGVVAVFGVYPKLTWGNL